MTSTTRQVLDYFEHQQEAVSLNHLANELHITQGTLEAILQYWVQKGKLREVTVDATVCNTCNIQNGCPFVTALPRYYERADASTDSQSCGCDGTCSI